MKTFIVKARSASGKNISYMIEAKDRQEAIHKSKEEGSLVFSLEEQRSEQPLTKDKPEKITKPQDNRPIIKKQDGWISKSFLPPIRQGYQIYLNRLEVAGVNHRMSEALRFFKSSGQKLTFERENNKHDENAIKIIGLSKGLIFKQKAFIGYVPKDVAKQIVKTGSTQSVYLRLDRMFLSKAGYLEINFQLMGLKEEKAHFDANKRR